jgi:glycosyltransferase involved in cell wall biosynthesis
MNIGYDGKRAFQNKTGLGNYIRSLMAILTHHYPQNKYVLFAPKQTDLFDVNNFPNVTGIFPQTALGKKFPALWRRRGMLKDIVNSKVDIFHGVSNEIPTGIEHTAIKSVVTVHDLIYERFPETYTLDVRYVSRWKIKHACKKANAVIAISQQTKDDLMNFYGVAENKISICYQSCNPIFQRVVGEEEKSIVKKRYNLPDQYFLFVSSITARKNLIAVCKSLAILKDKIDIPLVVIGNGKKEKEEARKFMEVNGVADRLIFLNDLPQSKELHFTTAEDFPAIYQQALALVYPSIFEGFGAPLLEALCSGLPVLSSNASCLPEVGGDAAMYFAPHDHATLAEQMLQLASDEKLVITMREKGFEQAQKFSTQQYADSIMQVYQKLL